MNLKPLRKRRLAKDRLKPLQQSATSSLLSAAQSCLRPPPRLKRETESVRTISRILDHDGRDVTGSVVHRNRMFRKAKDLLSEIKANTLTRSESMRTDPATIAKMRRTEMSPRVEALRAQYNNLMRAQGAHPNDYSYDRFRPRR